MSATELRARPFEGLEGLCAERAAWEELLPVSGADPLCCGPTWSLAYAQAWVDPAAVFGWVLEDGDGSPAALSCLRTEPRRSALALRRATLLQDGSFDSDYLDLLLRPGHERAAIDQLLDLLARRRGVQAVLLSCLPDDSPTWPLLRAALEERGLPRKEVPVGCAAMALPESFEQYAGSLKKRMRSKARAALRQSRQPGWDFAWCHEPAELDAHLERFFALHQARWTAAGEPGSFAGEQRRRFYRLLAPALLERGELAFARLERDGEPVAYQIGALVAGTYYQLQEGFDPAVQDVKLGNALRARMTEELIARGARRYDFMAGLSRHKSDWGAIDRPCTSVAFALPGLRARLAYGLRSRLG